MKKVFLISLFICLLDQIIKIIISSSLAFSQTIKIINNFFSITYLYNTGAAWSILSGNRLFLVLTGIITLAIIYFFLLKNNPLNKKLEYFAYGLLIGGILGNLIDRIRIGYVIDYLEFNIFNYNFPVFNLADSCIVIAVFLLLINEQRSKVNEKNSR